MNSSFEIFSAIFKIGLGTIAKVLFNALAIKVIAIFMGPYGVGLFSQLRQLWQTSVTIGSFNSGVAIIQGASSKVDSHKAFYINSVFWLVSLLNLMASILLIYFSKELSVYLFDNSLDESIELIWWVSLASYIGVYLIFFSSILSVYSALGRYAIVASTSGFILFLCSWPAAKVSEDSVIGLVWIIIISELIALILCLVFLYKDKLISLSFNKINLNYVKDFFKTSYVLLFTGVYFMVSLLIIRSMIIEKYGFYGAGIFDASWLICMVYVLVLTKSFGTYFLPKMSSIKDQALRKNLLSESLRIIILISVPIIVIMISFKPIIINLLYSNEFKESVEILKWMLIGDFFKILSWLLAFSIIAQKDMRTFFWLQIASDSLLLFGAYISIKYFDTLETVGIVFMLISIIYFFPTLLYNLIKNELMISQSLIIYSFFGVLIISFTSFHSWNDYTVNYSLAAINILLAVIFSYYILNKNERSWIVKKLNIKIS